MATATATAEAATTTTPKSCKFHPPEWKGEKTSEQIEIYAAPQTKNNAPKVIE